MPEKRTMRDFPSIEITLKAYNTKGEEGKPGLLSLVTSMVDVKDDEGNEAGYIGTGSGSLIVSVAGDRPAFYMIPLADIWEAIQEARE